MSDVQSRLLASGILYRATMRALAARLTADGLAPPTPAEKMALHQQVEEAAWALPSTALASVEGREVDDGLPDEPALTAVVDQLVAATVRARAA